MTRQKRAYAMVQQSAAVLAVIASVAWLRASGTWSYALSLRLPSRDRAAAGVLLVALGAGLVAYAVVGLDDFRATIAWPIRTIINQYTLGYWSGSLPLWLGMFCVACGCACLWPRSPT